MSERTGSLLLQSVAVLLHEVFLPFSANSSPPQLPKFLCTLFIALLKPSRLYLLLWDNNMNLYPWFTISCEL
jgi:hypothetical protein